MRDKFLSYGLAVLTAAAVLMCAVVTAQAGGPGLRSSYGGDAVMDKISVVFGMDKRCSVAVTPGWR